MGRWLDIRPIPSSALYNNTSHATLQDESKRMGYRDGAPSSTASRGARGASGIEILSSRAASRLSATRLQSAHTIHPEDNPDRRAGESSHHSETEVEVEVREQDFTSQQSATTLAAAKAAKGRVCM